jgi:hypothetical protein
MSHKVFIEPAHTIGRQILDVGGAAFLYEFRLGTGRQKGASAPCTAPRCPSCWGRRRRGPEARCWAAPTGPLSRPKASPFSRVGHISRGTGHRVPPKSNALSVEWRRDVRPTDQSGTRAPHRVVAHAEDAPVPVHAPLSARTNLAADDERLPAPEPAPEPSTETRTETGDRRAALSRARRRIR